MRGVCVDSASEDDCVSGRRLDRDPMNMNASLRMFRPSSACDANWVLSILGRDVRQRCWE